MTTIVPGSGHKGGLITFGKETTYAGGASPMHKLEVIDFEYTPNKIEEDDPNLSGDPELKDVFLGGFSVSGMMTLRANFDGLLEVMRGCHGSYSSAAVSGDATVRDHTFKTGDQLPFYSADVMMGNVPAGKVTRLDGLKFLGYDWTIDLRAGSSGRIKIPFFAANALTDQIQRVVTVVNCSTTNGGFNVTRAAGDWNAEVRPGASITGTNIPAGSTVASITSPTVLVFTNAGAVGATATGSGISMTLSPNAPSNFPVMARMTNQSGLSTWADGTGDALANVRLRNISIAYQQPHDTERFYGALNPDEPLRSERTLPKITVVQEYLTKAAFDQQKAHTSGGLVFQFQDPTTIGSTSKREWEFKALRSYLSNAKTPIPGPQSMIQTNEWKCTRDPATSSALTLRVRNLEVALV